MTQDPIDTDWQVLDFDLDDTTVKLHSPTESVDSGDDMEVSLTTHHHDNLELSGDDAYSESEWDDEYRNSESEVVDSCEKSQSDDDSQIGYDSQSDDGSQSDHDRQNDNESQSDDESHCDDDYSFGRCGVYGNWGGHGMDDLLYDIDLALGNYLSVRGIFSCDIDYSIIIHYLLSTDSNKAARKVLDKVARTHFSAVVIPKGLFYSSLLVPRAQPCRQRQGERQEEPAKSCDIVEHPKSVRITELNRELKGVAKALRNCTDRKEKSRLYRCKRDLLDAKKKENRCNPVNC